MLSSDPITAIGGLMAPNALSPISLLSTIVAGYGARVIIAILETVLRSSPFPA